ncbi:MAG: DUF4870 domain-containing protein [Kurthia sp.]|nr:DUF4870 domain-containing protein [Candidatus Kurthia equi]
MENKWIKVILHASVFFLPVIVPILFLLLVQDEKVKSLSIQALLFQFVMWVLIGISTILSFILIGLPFVIIFSLMTIIVPIIGIVKSLQDEDWDYPIVGRWV